MTILGKLSHCHCFLKWIIRTEPAVGSTYFLFLWKQYTRLVVCLGDQGNRAWGFWEDMREEAMKRVGEVLDGRWGDISPYQTLHCCWWLRSVIPMSCSTLILYYQLKVHCTFSFLLSGCWWLHVQRFLRATTPELIHGSCVSEYYLSISFCTGNSKGLKCSIFHVSLGWNKCRENIRWEFTAQPIPQTRNIT